MFYFLYYDHIWVIKIAKLFYNYAENKNMRRTLIKYKQLIIIINITTTLFLCIS